MTNTPNNRKDWWTPVWKGLVVDQEAKHYRRMKNALWLFLYLLLHANRNDGHLLRKIKTLCRDMCLKRGMILRWLALLKKHGYISTRNTGRYLSIQVKKWKPLPGVPNMEHQKYQKSNFRSIKNHTSEKSSESRNSFLSSQKSKVSFSPNDITIKRVLLKNDIDNKKNCFNSNFYSFKGIKPKTRKLHLAWEIARALNDPKGLGLYIAYSFRYPEPLLRKVLAEVKEIPDKKIKKSRGALFNHLIQKYGEETSHNPGN
ncbi:MAG: helix-turn-helix domain-containing protein [Thermodesulfobacteriota bacterium]|nr:MAG: helix-turn-helix domain-containing protein [Thermodesulfobacteriota bacterium]